MNKNIKNILVGIGFVALSVVLLIVYFVLKPLPNENDIAKNRLIISANDITLQTGQSLENFYEISNNNAVITFSSDNEQIYNIEDKTLYALSAGVANITITATLLDQTASTTICVKIMNESYSYHIECIASCEIDNNGNFCMLDNFSQFQVYVYDKLLNVVSATKTSITVNNNSELIYEAPNYTLVAYTNCEITIACEEGSLLETIPVIIQF